MIQEGIMRRFRKGFQVQQEKNIQNMLKYAIQNFGNIRDNVESKDFT